MRWWLLLAMACSSAHHASPLANTEPAQANPRAESDAVVTAVLARFVADPSTMPDHGILPKTGPVYVLREIGQDPTTGAIAPAALPANGARPFVLKALADVQAEADRIGDSVHFIRFYAVDVDGDRAVISVGVDFVLPTNTRALKMCCCSGADRYEKRSGRWTFASRGVVACS